MASPSDPAFPEALLEHAGWVRKLARALCLDEHAAADLEQETWLAALRGGVEARDPRAWLGGVARRLAAKTGRGEGRRSAHERDAASARPPESPDTAETLAAVELSARLARAVAELDEPYRTTVALRYYEGLPPRRNAARLGVDVRAVESRLRRGRERLRETLDGQCGGREVWFGVAAALALAGGESGGRGVALVAALVLLIGGSVGGGIALQRSQALAAGERRSEVELRDDFAERSEPATRAERSSAAEPEAQDSRVPVLAPVGGVELVIAGSGLPHADAEVRWGDRSGHHDVRSDALGRVLFQGGDGVDEAWIIVDETDHTRRLNTRSPLRALTRLEVSRRGGRIEGLVVDLEQRPVAGAEVLAWRNEPRSPDLARPDRTARSDARGRFVLDDVAGPSGDRARWSLAARAQGLSSYGRLAGDFDPRRDADEPTLVLEPAWDVRGRVFEGAGVPLPGVQLFALLRGSARDATAKRSAWTPAMGSPELQVLSSEDGSFAFQLVAPASPQDSSWRLQANSSAHRRVLLDVDRPSWLDVRLERGFLLEGQVVDASGRPVAEARVELRSKERRLPASTDASGRFAFDGLSELAGAMLSVTAPGHALAVRVVNLPSREGPCLIQLEAECRLEGIALDARGVPLRNANIHFEGDRSVDSDWLSPASAMLWENLCVLSNVSTDSAGRFLLQGLYPGRFTLQLSSRPARDVLAFATVQLVPGQNAEPLELRVGAGLEQALTIRGRVLDAVGGLPVTSFTVMGRRELPGNPGRVRETLMQAHERADGSFELRGLIPGRWTFGAFSWESGAHRGSRPEAPETYSAGVYDLELCLTPAGQR